MDIPRYLVFDHQNEIVKLSVQKIKGQKLITMAKDLDDIEKFNPTTVICYQNDNVVYECKKSSINCVHIYQLSKYYQNPHKHVCNFLVRRLDLDSIKRDDKNYSYNFTMIQEATDEIASTVVSFEGGNNVLINPGKVLTSEILDFYRIERETRDLDNGENRTSVSSYPSKLTAVENYFQEVPDAKINLYLATYHRMEKTKKSLRSIVEDVKLSKNDIKVYIGDNSPNFPEMREWLREFEEDNKDLVSVHFGEKNIGKSGMVNHLYENSRDCDYLFSIDSDMVVSKETNFVDEMIFYLTRLENCGLISSNQSDCCQHWFGKSIDVITRQGLKVGFSEDGIGIAGGCVCLRSDDWEKIGKYKEGHDIYTGDDGILTHNIGKILGKYVYVSMDCTLDHPSPGEEEKEYTEWKGKSWQRDQLKFLNKDYKGENTKGFYD